MLLMHILDVKAYQENIMKISGKLGNLEMMAAAAAALFLLSVAVLERKELFLASGDNAHREEEKICVVIDAGHGGGKLRVTLLQLYS